MTDQDDGAVDRTGPVTHSALPEHRIGAPSSLFRDPERLLRPARLFLFLFMAAAIIGIGSDVLELRLLAEMDASAFPFDPALLEAAEANDRRQMFVGVGYLLVLVVTFIFVGRWIYFSAKNLRQFGAADLTIRPGWAVGWYFVPIANLWKPYQAMKEIWQASANPLDWQNQRPPGLLPTWWAIWLISSLTDQAVFRLSNAAETIAEFELAARVSLVGAGLDVALGLVFLTLISRITRLQIDAVTNKSLESVFS